MKKLQDLPLKHKLFILTFLITTLLSIALMVLLFQFYNQNISKRVHQDHKDLFLLIMSKVQSEVQIHEQPQVNPLLQAFLSNEDILDIAVYRNDFEIANLSKNTKKFYFDLNQHASESIHDDHAIYYEKITARGSEYKLFLRTSLAVIVEARRQIYLTISIFGGIVLLIGLPTVYFLVDRISKPINELSEIANQISTNQNYQLVIPTKGNDEIGKLYHSFAYMLKQINQQQNAIREINQNLEHKIEERVAELQEAIKKSKELTEALQAKQRIDESLVKFTEIISSNVYNNIERWGDNLLYHLVKFIHADIAALYITDDLEVRDVKLRLISSYAYDVKTMLKRGFEAGDGITGQAIKNQETLFLTDLPEGFLKISTILGEAAPACVLIVPLIAENSIQGVFEIASLKLLSENEIHFVQKVAETTAFTLLLIKNRENIQKLLYEAQDKNEKLLEQEQEMIKTIQKLEVAQKEMQAKDIEMSGQLAAIDSTLETIEMNMNGIITRVNSAFLQSTGYSLEELLNKPHRLIAQDPNNPNLPFWETFWNELNQGKPQSGEYTLYGKNQNELWYYATYTPVLNAEGLPYKIIMLATNITEQKLQALDYEGQISAINKSTASIQYNMRGEVLKINGIANSQLQLPQISHLKDSFIETDEDDKQELFAKIWNEIRFGRAYSAKMKRKKGADGYIWVNTTFYPILDLNEKPIKVLEFFTNITQQVEAEEKIRNLMQETQQANEALKAQEEELLQNMEELEATQDELRKTADELKKSEENLKLLNEDLEKRVQERTAELEQTLHHLKNTQSQLVQSEKMASLGQLVAGIAHEINTPIGAVKASAENMNDVLPLVVQQYPALLKNLPEAHTPLFLQMIDLVLNAQKNLTSREERSKRKLLSQTLEQHQIQEPDDIARKLVEIGIYENIEPFMPLFQHTETELLLNVLYHIGQLKVNLDNIAIASAKTRKIVFALKNYAYQKQDENAVMTDLRDSVDTILTLYHNQMKYGIEVTTDFEEVPKVPCYPDEIGQVWTNIIHNAIQAMNYSGSLHVAINNVVGGVQVAITDSGPGIPPEIQTKIFEPFFTTKPQGEGTGMGLDITMKIIKKHNGTISLESQPGKTTFFITLPLTNDLPLA